MDNELWLHIKTNNYYRVLMTAVNEIDGVSVVVYESYEGGVRFVRPASSFYDGRFRKVTDKD